MSCGFQVFAVFHVYSIFPTVEFGFVHTQFLFMHMRKTAGGFRKTFIGSKGCNDTETTFLPDYHSIAFFATLFIFGLYIAVNILPRT
jgi:hypothetical protein